MAFTMGFLVMDRLAGEGWASAEGRAKQGVGLSVEGKGWAFC